MKIIIVDDDPSVLSLLQGLVQRKGHTALTYLNPLECPLFQPKSCPCAASAPCPDIVISDYNMPHVNGMEFLENIHKRGCQCAHSALIPGSGLVEGDLIRLARFGTRHFPKPVDFAEFYDWLDRVERQAV